MNLGHLKILLALLFFSNQVIANPIQKQYANFKLLDKISNKLITKSIEINESAILGTLNINVYICFTEPPDEIPEDYVLVDIKDEFESKEISIYKGWMISSSPDVTPLEHPIYDLWLLNCSNDKTS
tara:strand:- start:312 stop:689 length:378 start_codon:yes stop_codon:yes gene_type:complete